MKKLYLFLHCSVIIFYSCNAKVTEDTNPLLNGKWILVNVSGGIAGDIVDVDTQVERHLVVFYENNSVSFFYNDSLLSTNNFHFEKRESIYSVNKFDFIIYEKNLPPAVITYLSDDTLVIADNNYDGFTKVYTKQNK